MDKELAACIGAAARAARKALGLTQEDAAERIGVSVEFYARIERGNSLPSIVTFARIAMVLGVSADALLGRDPTAMRAAAGQADWAPSPPQDSPEVRRVTRRLRMTTPGVIRVVSVLLKEIERMTEPPGNQPDGDSGD